MSVEFKNNNHDDGINNKINNRYTLFKIGSLRFDLGHGVMGIISSILVTYSLYLTEMDKRSRRLYNSTSWINSISESDFDTDTVETFDKLPSFSLPPLLFLSIVVSTTILAFGSTNLLHQVPNSSIITWFIIPPHRLAFERTISVIGYLNLRLVHQWIQQQKRLLDWLFTPKLTGNNTGNNGWISLLFPIGLLFYQTHQFFPLHLDYCNGNTYVFVIPMWIGLLVDCIHQFPVIGKIDRSSMVLLLHWRDNMSSIQSQLNSSEVWEKVNYWNENIVDVHYLILTLLCALQVAFMFSVSFRGHLDIRICYWIAALVVGFLCIRLGNSISA